MSYDGDHCTQCGTRAMGNICRKCETINKLQAANAIMREALEAITLANYSPMIQELAKQTLAKVDTQ